MTDQEVYDLYVAAGGTASVNCFGPNYPAYDFDKNCMVDINDFAAFSTEWLMNNMVP